MDLELSEDQELLRRTVRTLLDAESPASLARSVVEGTGDAGALWEQMVSLDWPGLAVPESCGGSGLGIEELAIVAEQIGEHLAPGPFVATACQFVPVVQAAGSTEQHERFLTPVALGQPATVAVADHPARWRLRDASTTAVQQGGRWCLSGRKHAVLSAEVATEVAVTAREAGSDRVDVFVVPRTAVRVEAVESLDRSRPLATVLLDEVVVDEDRRLAVPTARVDEGLGEVVVLAAAEAVGACRSLLDLVVAHVTVRRQFGAVVGSFQAVKHTLADMLVALERASSLVRFATAAIAEHHQRRGAAASMAKAAAGDCQRVVGRGAVQMLGGVGFTWEHDAQLYVKRAMTMGALFGTAADHRLAVAGYLGLGASGSGVVGDPGEPSDLLRSR